MENNTRLYKDRGIPINEKYRLCILTNFSWILEVFMNFRNFHEFYKFSWILQMFMNFTNVVEFYRFSWILQILNFHIEWMATVRECNFRTGRILGKRFPNILPVRKLDISTKLMEWNSKVPWEYSGIKVRNMPYIKKRKI